jgi:hypothetical protein
MGSTTTTASGGSLGGGPQAGGGGGAQLLVPSIPNVLDLLSSCERHRKALLLFDCDFLFGNAAAPSTSSFGVVQGPSEVNQNADLLNLLVQLSTGRCVVSQHCQVSVCLTFPSPEMLLTDWHMSYFKPSDVDGVLLSQPSALGAF